MRPYIPIDDIKFPQQFEIQLSDNVYTIGINYNKSFDSFSIDLYDANDEPIILGDPVVLGRPLWCEFNDPRIPLEPIIPLDESDNETEVTLENFGNTVKLYLDILDEDINGVPIPDIGDD